MSGAGFKVESGMQLLSRLCKKTEMKLFYPSLFSSIPKYGDIIEISSDDAIPSLLLDIICEVLMPFELGGTELGVLVLSTDGNFNIDHICKVLSMKLTTCSADKVNEISQECLKNLVLIEIYNTTQFYTAILNLDSTMSENHNIGLIVINSLNAFYWSEQGFKLTKMNYYLQNLLQKIHIVVKQYKPIIMYTRPDSFGTNREQEVKKTTDIFTNGEKFTIQVVTHKNNFEVSIVSKNMNMKKTYTINDGSLKWL